MLPRLTSHLPHCITIQQAGWTLRHFAARCLILDAPHAILKNSKKNRFWLGLVKYNTIPVWRWLIRIVLSVINSGPNNYYGIDRIPVCTGSGMYRLHCTNDILIDNQPVSRIIRIRKSLPFRTHTSPYFDGLNIKIYFNFVNKRYYYLCLSTWKVHCLLY